MSYAGVVMEQREHIAKLEAEAIVLRARITELEDKIDALDSAMLEAQIAHEMEMDR